MAEERPSEGPLQRIAAFRGIYLGIFAYAVLAVIAIDGADRLMTRHFEKVVAEAVRVTPSQSRVIPQIQERLTTGVSESAWTRIWGVRVNAIVLGADGLTPIYLGGRTLPPPPTDDPRGAIREAMRLLPAIATVDVAVPLDSLLAGSVLVALGAIIVPLLFLQQRRLARREEELIAEAMATRDATAQRARSIQSELDKVQRRLGQVEPIERAQVDEIQKLEQERAELHERLRAVSERETSLRASASNAGDLDRERQALEDLLDEAVQDLEVKEREIHALQDRVAKAAKGERTSRGRGRAAEQLAKRMRTLYPRLAIDDRAIQDMADLGDESLRLRAEEALKKLEADPDSAAVRRKVGGLPAGLSIFELGFAGKGRIYYANRPGGFRVLAVGGKASQKTDLEYLSKLSVE